MKRAVVVVFWQKSVADGLGSGQPALEGAGIVIAIGWPVSSLFVLGAFLAIDLIFQGVAITAFGLSLRR